MMRKKPVSGEQSTGEKLILERVQNKLQQEYRKKNEKYRHIGGGLFKASVAAYYIFSVWYFLVLIANMFVAFFAVERYTQNENYEKAAFFRSNAVIMAVMLVLLVLSFVLMLLKKRKIACGFAIAGTAALAVQFLQIASGSYTEQLKMSMFYIPAVLVLPAALTMLLIIRGDERREQKAYAKELGKIYRRFSSNGEVLMTNDKWRQVISEYENEKNQKQ